jgi:hypothetical protein
MVESENLVQINEISGSGKFSKILEENFIVANNLVAIVIDFIDMY